MFKMFSTMTAFVVLALCPAQAQSNQPVQANIPFAFTVQQTRLAAGNYQLTYSSNAHILSIQGLDQTSKALFATAMSSTDARRAGQPGRLVFHCYSKGCYLAQVWQGARLGGGGLRLPQTQQESRIALLTRTISITIPAR